MISLAVLDLKYHVHKDSFLARLWRQLTLKRSTTRYHINSIEFYCRNDIKPGHKFRLGNMVFCSTDSVFDMFDHHWHICAKAVDPFISLRKKPMRVQFAYLPLTKIYGEEPIHA